MRIIDQLKNNFPTCIKKDGEVFSALMNSIAGRLDEADQYSKEWVNTPGIYEQTGQQLSITGKFFSFLERYKDESDKAYKQRIKSIFYRNGNTVWGNPYDVKSMFEQYFPHAHIFVVENVGQLSDDESKNENLILDGDFQAEDVWELTDCTYSENARFSKAKGVLLANGSNCKQEVEIEKNKIYFLHFFLKGKCKVQIKDNDGRYWNNTTYYDSENEEWINGFWQNESFEISYMQNDWNDCNLKIITDNSETLESIEIKIIGTENGSFLDYVRLFEYKNYPTFTVIAHYEGDSVEQDAAALAPGTNDVISDPLENYSYIEYAFLTGVNNAGYSQDIYEDLLKYVKATGVKAYIDIVQKDL